MTPPFVIFYIIIMFTPEECRKIDPDLTDLSDEELIKSVDTLHKLAELVLDFCEEKRRMTPIKTMYSISGRCTI